jgi:hypothetical protein
MRTALLALVLTLLAGPLAHAGDVTATALVDGEVLVYRARVWKGLEFIDMEVGRATFTTTRDSDGVQPVWSIVAKAKGGALGYEVNTTIRSRTTLARESISYGYEQTGSEQRRQRLEFGPAAVTYTAFQHCPGEGCELPEHQGEEGYQSFQ